MKKIKEGESRVTITVGMATCGIAAGARETMKSLLDYIRTNNLEDVTITQTGCNGMCEYEPIIDVQVKDGAKYIYGHVHPDRIGKIMEQHVAKGEPVDEWVLKTEETAAS